MPSRISSSVTSTTSSTLSWAMAMQCSPANGGAIFPSGGDLLRARALPHDDHARDPLERSAVGERLRVVAGGDADHAARLLLGRQGRQLGKDAADLERAGALEELRLQVDVAP